MKQHPTLAIVGRPNVGKSALFNRICGKQISLVYDRPGVTRDRLIQDVRKHGKTFTLIDTGGIGLEDASGLEKEIEREVNLALETAEDILFVVDGREGIHVLDEEIAKKLRRSKKRVFLVVNKLDSDKQEDWDVEFNRLGLGEPYPVSAEHGRGVNSLLSDVVENWEDFPEAESEIQGTQQRPIRVALVGKPNVGKSSLINAALQNDRLVVSPVSGTTRDAVDVPFRLGEKNYCFIDTAGMRKKRRIADPLESAMTGRSAHTIQRADICVLVVDALEGVGEQEKKIAGLIQEASKPCLILVNKWDLVRERIPKGETEKDWIYKYEKAIRQQLFFAPYAPMVFLSAQKKFHMKSWLKELERVEAGRRERIGTGVLNRLLQRAMERQPAPRKGGRGIGKRFKIYYASQLVDEFQSCPVLTVFVNQPGMLTEDYRRYLEQVLRKEVSFYGSPVKWLFKPHHVSKS